jgi:probable HAF family extracellular repeat protein
MEARSDFNYAIAGATRLRERGMRKNLNSLIVSLGLCALMMSPTCVLAQSSAAQNQVRKHHRYKMVVIEPLGGPGSTASGPGLVVLNSGGTYAAIANTAAPNPNPSCFILLSPPDCFVEHAVVWRNGLQTDLGTLPGGNNSQTVGISANGLITGSSESGVMDPYSGLPENFAVLWAGKKLVSLGTLPNGTESIAFAVNSHGLVAGISNNDIPDPFSAAGFTTQTRAVLWQDGQITDLGTLGGPDAYVYAMSERGQVIGLSYTTSTPSPTTGVPTQDPFFWENGRMWDIGTLGGTQGVGYQINNRGQVVGNSNLAGDQTSHAFVWDKENGLKDLGTLPGGNFSYANWVNDAGEIVGSSDSLNGIPAVLWKNGVIIDLGTLPGELFSEALSINSSGQIVGHSSQDAGDGNAVLWENGQPPVNLNTLVVPASDVTAVYPVQINDRGEIAAHAITSSGELRAVLLIPCDSVHPNLEGCDYRDTEEINENVAASAVAASAKFSSLKMMRIHARMISHNRRF